MKNIIAVGTACVLVSLGAGLAHAQSKAAAAGGAEIPAERNQAGEDKTLSDCKPTDVTQALACLDDFLSKEDKQEVAALPAEELFKTHFGLGLAMRNAWLGQGGPLPQALMHQGLHPDDMSSLIVDAYWLKLHGCEAAWNDVRAVKAAKARFVAGEACAGP